MDVSIIICTHNRARLLRDALTSLEQMTLPAGCLAEVVIADNASNDDTAAVIGQFAKKNGQLTIRGIRESRLGKTRALNKAINEVSGTLLALIDDDHIVTGGYLKAVCRAARENPSCNLLCGRILPNWDGTEPAWVHDNTVYPIRPFPIPQFDLGNAATEVTLQSDLFLPGAGNLVVRRSVFDKVGLFSEELGPKGHNLAGGEDIEFVRRALHSGERLLYIPEILQYHQVERSKLKLVYQVKKAYLRSMAAYRFSGAGTAGRVPAYLYGQAVERAAKAVFAFNQNARRYYLVRLAAVLGEMRGRRRGKALGGEK